VDVFNKIGSEVYEGQDYVRPALRGTRFAELALKQAQKVEMAAGVRR
jgi:hypothetical protein